MLSYKWYIFASSSLNFVWNLNSNAKYYSDLAYHYISRNTLKPIMYRIYTILFKSFIGVLYINFVFFDLFCSSMWNADDSLWCKRNCQTLGTTAPFGQTSCGRIFRPGRPWKTQAQYPTYCEWNLMSTHFYFFIF